MGRQLLYVHTNTLPLFSALALTRNTHVLLKCLTLGRTLRTSAASAGNDNQSAPRWDVLLRLALHYNQHLTAAAAAVHATVS